MTSKKKLIELASRAKQYDQDAFSELFDIYFEPLKRYIYYQTGELEVAEELASEVFTKALQCINDFSDRGGTIGAWLYGIARNLVARHRYDKSKAHTVALGKAELLAGKESPEKSAIDSATYESLYDAISDLPNEQKEVVVLRFIEGFDSKTVASLMGKKPGAVRALQHRAIVALRKTMSLTERSEGLL